MVGTILKGVPPSSALPTILGEFRSNPVSPYLGFNVTFTPYFILQQNVLNGLTNPNFLDATSLALVVVTHALPLHTPLYPQGLLSVQSAQHKFHLPASQGP